MSRRVARLCAEMNPRQRRLVVTLYAFATAEPGVTYDLGLTTPAGDIEPQKLSADGVACGRYLVRTDTTLATLYRQVLEREAGE